MSSVNSNTSYNLAILIPFYNEESRISADVFTTFALEHKDIFLVLINDGSSDNTNALLTSIHNSSENNTIVVQLKENAGKGNAIRNGLLKIIDYNIPFIAYMDADLSAPFEQILRLHQLLKASDYSAIFGARLKKLDSHIERSFFRHISGRFVATIIDTRFKIGCYDTQCGAKVFRKESLLPTILNDPFYTRWFFDVEIILRMRKETGQLNISEIALNNWEHKAGSKLNAFSVFSVFKEIYTLFRKY